MVALLDGMQLLEIYIVKMKKIIIFSIIAILLLSLVGADRIITQDNPTEFTKNLESKPISKANETKLLNTYGIEFTEVKKFNSYKEYKEFTILNVTMNNNKYSRIITKTSKYNRVTK